MPYYRLFYHFVWSTKERLPLITQINRETIYRAIVIKVDDLRGIVHALNGMADHVHLVATVPPNIALSTFIGQVKGSSSYSASRLSQADEEIPFTWQTEYGLVSTSEAHLPIVVRYVQMQQQHHRENKLHLTLENC